MRWRGWYQSPILAALIIGGLYGILSVSWILFSDAIARSYATSLRQLTVIQSNKGIAFVGVSACMIAVLVYVTVKRLADQLQFTHDALDALRDPFYVLDTDGKLRQWNQAAIETTGRTPTELAGIHATTLFTPEDRDRIRESIERVLKHGGDTIEANIIGMDGRGIPHEFRTRRFTDADGQVVGLVGIGRDIAERRERRRHLQVIDQFLRHNIRNSLNIIMGNSELLESDPDAIEGAATTIRRQGRNMLKEVEQHRQIVTLFTDAQPSTIVDLSQVVDEAVSTVREQHEQTDFRVEIPPHAEVATFANIRVAIEELLESAVSDDDGDAHEVEVAIEDADDGITIQLRTDRRVIPPSERAVLMGEHEIDQLHHGSGFGLWLPYWLIQRVGGYMDIENSASNGTVVTVYHPRTD